jgi:hypothetical protein
MVSMRIEFVIDPRQITFSKHAEQLWKRTKLHMHAKKRERRYYMDKEADKVTHLPKNICHGSF